MNLFRFKLGHKFLAGTLGIILLLGLLLIFFVRSALTSKLILEIQEKGIYIAKHLADASSDHLLTEHILNLQMMIDDQVEDSDVEYIFIRDSHGAVPAHSFKDGFPVGLININIPGSSDEYSLKSFESEGMTMYDIAAPIMKGDLGAVHVGISESFIRGSVADIVTLILKIVAGVLVFGCATAIIFARRVTKPLSELVETSRQIGSGNFDAKVGVRTDDEIGELGMTFNAMAGRLKDTTVSRDELRSSYEFTKTVLNSMNESVAIIDVNNFTIIGANAIFLKEYGMKEAEVIGKTCHEVTHKQQHPCGPPHDSCPLKETMNTGKYSSAEHRHYSKDGEIRYVEVSTSPIIDNTGRLIQVVHVSNDLTDRKLIEERLLAERDRAQNYLDIAGVMLLAIDVDRKVTLINKRGCDILGYEEEREIVGKNWFDNFVPERSREEVSAAFDYLMAGETTSFGYYENTVLTRDGREKIIAWQNTILRDRRGTIIGTLSSGEDITKRRQAEAEVALKQEELIKNNAELNKLFRAVEIAHKEQQKVMDSLGDIIILTNEEGKIIRINHAIKKFTDKSYNEILDRGWEDLIYENELE
ncbi:MAG: PAS domain S-box protein, partial [Nitrospirota bacterium]